MGSLARFVVTLILSLLILGAGLGLFVAWFFKSSLLFGALVGAVITAFAFWGWLAVRADRFFE